MLFSVFAARDGDVFHDSVQADDQDEAESLARELVADSWDMADTLKRYRDDDDELGFDAELDGFAVDREEEKIERAKVAAVFALAKDAPTSFEDEQWLEGFEEARRMIAQRIALSLPDDERAAFLAACQCDEEPEQLTETQSDPLRALELASLA